MKEIQKVLVVGAGTMGHGLAQVFATKGISVSLADQTDELLERAKRWIAENLSYMVELGEIGQEQIEPTLARIQFTTDLKHAAQDVDYVLEAIVENLDLKKDVFQQLDAYTGPDVILASNTSSFDINELSQVTAHPERVIGTHWFHPPQITPCVEVIPSDTTSRETIDLIMRFLERMGKAPTLCKSSPGFVANRIQYAMVSEALAIIEEGLATPEAVDRIVKSSFGFRLGAYGPCEICDQAGLDVYHTIFKYFYGKFKRSAFKPPKILDRLIKQGRYGLKAGKGFYDYEGEAANRIERERDRKLYARLSLFRAEQKSEKK
jgi:3-hydroxybutyryl-CoA dehydrogenase